MAGVLSYDEIKAVWIRNGGDPNYAPIAAAIALAESGGRYDVVSKPNTNGTVDNGLWQINQPKANPDLLTPDANARIAISMSHNGQTWRPWCTAYSDGACGTKGGSYLGSSAPFWTFLAAGSRIPGTNSFSTVQPQTIAPPPGSGKSSAELDAATHDTDALLKLPGVGTVLTVSQGRAITSVLCIAAGVAIAGVGVVLLAGKSVAFPNPVGAVQDFRLNREIDRGERAAPDQVAQRESYRKAAAGTRRLPTGEEAF